MKGLISMVNFNKHSVFLLILVIQVFIAVIAQAQEFYFQGNRSKDAIGFSLVKNLIIIPLYINNKGPFNFILDTGVGPLIITDPTLIDSVGLVVSRSIKVSGLGKGNEIDAFVSNDVSCRLGKASIERIPTAILKQDIFGFSNYLGTKIYGLLGYYFFKSFVVEIKYPGRRLLFSSPESKHRIKGEKIPIEISGDKPYINISIETPELGVTQLKTLVDNGASHAISLERLNGTPFPVPSNSITANLGVGMSGPINGSIGRVPLLKIGGFVLKNVLASYPEYDDVAAKVILKDRNGNLGANILSRFNVVFDYSRNALYLKKNNQFNRPFQHDMSGIEVYLQEDKIKHYLISRIEANSPAQNAGILVDDEILQINFLPVYSFKLNDIDLLFKSSDGKTIILSILRGKDVLVKILKLKQRI